MVDVVKELQSYGTEVTIYDPLANPAEVEHEYGLKTTNQLPEDKFDAVVLTVAHNEFLEMELDTLKNDKAVIYDVKGILGKKPIINYRNGR